MILHISGGRAASFIVVLFFVVHRTTVELTHYNYIVHLKVTPATLASPPSPPFSATFSGASALVCIYVYINISINDVS